MSKIFVSYRGSDPAPYASRLLELLTAQFGDSQVFTDLEMEPRDDFVERLEDWVRQCDLLLVVIGPDWLRAQDSEGRWLLDDPEDFVRIEVRAALKKHGPRMLPVLVGGATMPSERDLPDDLAFLSHWNPLKLSDLRSRSDADRLIEVIEEILHPPPIID